jgi:hypothetical protein
MIVILIGAALFAVTIWTERMRAPTELCRTTPSRTARIIGLSVATPGMSRSANATPARTAVRARPGARAGRRPKRAGAAISASRLTMGRIPDEFVPHRLARLIDPTHYSCSIVTAQVGRFRLDFEAG